MNVHVLFPVESPTPTTLFESHLYAVAARWNRRGEDAITALCNRMGATRDQRANAIRAYMAERQRHGG